MAKGKIVVVDTETTGLDSKLHEMIQLCAIALNDDFTPDKGIPPFLVNMRPRRYIDTPEYRAEVDSALKVNGVSFKKIGDYTPCDDVIPLWEKWWAMANKGEALEPLAQNWPFDKGFMEQWLGVKSMQDYFVRHYRDTYSASRFLRDRCFHNDEVLPFSEGHSLNKLCKALDVKVEQFHSAYDDALATAACYKKMLEYVGIPKTGLKPL